MHNDTRNGTIVFHPKDENANRTVAVQSEIGIALKEKSHHHFSWFGPAFIESSTTGFGLKLRGGGVHQSKTMMSKDIDKVMVGIQLTNVSPKTLVVEDNILSKSTLSTRKLTYANLNALYSLEAELPIYRVMKALRYTAPESKELLYLMASLVRDPLLRDSAEAILTAPMGKRVSWSSIAEVFQAKFPERFTQKMLRSLSQNCASSWTQSGHLEGRVKKIRRRITPRPCVVAFGALIASLCGFGGSTLLESPWLRILDINSGQALDLLRQAEAQGLARVRSIGDVLEISIRQQMARTMGVPDFA